MGELNPTEPVVDVVKAVERKLNRLPSIPELRGLFQATCGDFRQENFSRFVERRRALLRRKVTSFLGIEESP